MRNPIPPLLSPSVAGGMFLFLLLTACGQQNSFPDDNALYDMEVEEEIIPITRQAEVVPPPPSFFETGDDQAPADEVVKSLIIRQGDMEIEVKEVEKAKAGLDVLVQTHKGYYSNEQYQDAWNRLSYTLSIRIPRSEEHTSELQSRPHLVCRLTKFQKDREQALVLNSCRWWCIWQ